MAGNDAPPFWYENPGWQSILLSPLSWLYGAIVVRRMDHAKPAHVNAPVLCIGNLTVGGTGKTPTALELANIAKQQKYKPGFVSRGYGGSHIRPHLVDVAHDIVGAVGDEPLLLAKQAPTMIGRNRAACAQALIDGGCDFIIMDDGFQSRSLYYDYALITLDARRGIGNGAVLPAGPLRAPLRDQMRHATSILRIGEGDRGDSVVRAASRAAKPMTRAHLKPRKVAALENKQVFAFTGIGDPQKFYDTLASCNCFVAATRSFGDHHVFTQAEASQLLERARLENLVLVTTEKDAVRLSHIEGPLAELREKTLVLPVSLVFENNGDGERIIANVVENYSAKKITGAV